MKTYRKRIIQISTLAMVLVIALSCVGGCFHNTDQTSYLSSDKVTVTNITDSVGSLTDEFVLTNDEYNVWGANDSCWVIVRFKSESILDSAMRVDPNNIYTYINSEDALTQAASISKAQSKFEKKYSSYIQDTSFRYNALLNGIAVKVRYGDIAKLEKDSSVQDVILCEQYYAPQAVTQNEVNVYSTGIYDPGDVGYDGTGTIIAVLDTGLDYTHTAFAEQPTGTLAVDLNKVRSLLSGFTATSMSKAIGDELTADELYVSDKVPFAYDYADIDPDVYPSEDHGTHVAGIIAGHDDVITGIATNAQLAIMKVFSNVSDNGASTDGILAALNDCVVLGVDAINMSLGSSCGYSRESDDDAVNEIYDSIRQAGICLICAASNDYSSAHQSENGDMSLATNPDYGTVGSPSSYEAAMSVASISGVKTRYLMVNGEQEVYFTEAGNTGSLKRDFAKELLGNRQSAEFEYVVIPGLGSESNYYDIDVTGKIAVIKRGNINFEEKVTIAQSHGAIGAIIYNNVSGTITMSVGKSMLPVCSVSMDMGKYFEAHTKGKFVINEDYQAGPFMSDFSSWGPLPNLEFKPDITAHGGDIYSAVRGGYDHFSGTSMAAPNMAGATILVRQYVKERFPELSAYEVTELTYQLLMSTATIAYNEEGNPYSPRKQGAGLADIGKSVATSAYLYVDGTNKPKLTLGDDPERTGVYEMTFKVRNFGSSAISYVISPIVMTESLSSDNKTVSQKAYMLEDTTFEVSVDGQGATLGANNTLLISSNATASVTVKITLSGDAKAYLDNTFANGMYVEGYIQLLAQSQDVDLNIGFLGFYGDWSVAPMLDVTAYQIGEEQEDPSILEDDKLKADVYGTLPMSGFRYQVSDTEYEEGYYGMGQFGYKTAEGYEEPAIIEDKASLTANIDGSYSLKLIAAGLLRNAKTVHMQITDAVTGELIWQGEDYDCRKSYYSGGRRAGVITVDFYVSDYNLANNSRYTFSMECELDWNSTENNLKNTFSFDFYIDNEAPIIVDDRTQVRVERSNGRNRYYLDLFVYDNHYVQGLQIGTFSSIDEEGEYVDGKAFHKNVIPFTDAKRNTITRFSYEITEYWSQIWKNNGNVFVEVIDYAKNRSSFHLQLPSSIAEKIGFTSTMRTVNTRVNEVVDLKEYLVTTPNDLWVKDLIWSVDDESVAVVRDGVVLGVGVGSTTLHVTNRDGSAEVTLPVTVRESRNDRINLTQIQLDKSRVTIERGEEFTIDASLVPHDLFADIEASLFADVKLVWTTSGGITKFVTYDDNGNEVLVDRVENATSVTVRSLRSGSATINVIAEGSSSRVSSSCSVAIRSEFEVDGAYLMSYTGRGDENGVVEIPDDLGVSLIYPYAFMANPYITKIIVPDGITQIMEAAIYGCDNLKEVVLPESCKTLDKWSIAWNPSLERVDLGGVNTIGEMAFIMNSSLKEIDFSGVFTVGPRAFMYCDALTEIDLTSVKSMGEMAFAMCLGLNKITTGGFTPIGVYGFYGCPELTQVELNGGKIGDFAFAECTNLADVTINNAVDTIGYAAFYDCSSLKQVTYNSTVRVISDWAFADCAFDTIVIPDGVEYVGTYAYGFDDESAASYGGATEVVISAGAKLTTIGIDPFYHCDNLKAFTVEDGNAYLSSVDGILYDKAQSKVILIPSGYVNNSLTLPATVVEIGDNAFSTSSIKTVTGENVTKIGNFAFYGSSIATVNFNEHLSYIGDGAFYGASNLRTWPSCFNNVKYIGESAFAIEPSYTGSTTYGLSGSVTLPETLTHLGSNAFYNTKVTHVTLSSKLTEIGEYTFADCSNLQYVTLNNGLKTIGPMAFAYCPSLRSISIPDSVESIGYGAFAYCTALSNVKLSNGLTEIADYLFVNCSALKSITLPDSVKVIGEGAFSAYNSTQTAYGESALTTINLDNVEHIDAIAFIGTQLTRVNAPKLVSIGERAFAFTTITDASMPELKSVGIYAFAGCARLQSIDIGSATTIGESAFYMCTALTEVDMSNVKELGAYAFEQATKLTNVKFEHLESIGQCAFIQTAITKLHLPATIRSIALQGLYGADKLESVTVDDDSPLYFTDEGALYKRLPSGLLSLVYYPVANKSDSGNYQISCIALELTVRVEAYAFAGNTHLKKIVLPERLQVLGAGAFYGCTALSTIELRSAAAPVLEMIYDEEIGIDNHYYNIFENTKTPETTTVNIIYPSNGTGYDNYSWQMYLKDNLFATGEIARTQTTIDMSDTLTDLDVSSLTLDDLQQIVLLRRIYASLDSAQKEFLTEVISTLSSAEMQLATLLMARIDALPDKVTADDRAEITKIRSLLNQCNSEISSKVTNVDKLVAAEEKLANLTDNNGEKDNSWVLPTVLGIVGAVVIAAAVVVTLLLLKRKKATANEGAIEQKSIDDEQK